MSWERCAPKLGDTASLWNHTAAPGWTPEDTKVLKLGLMKFGMGQWVKILDTGLLPGKLIQQLNGQTQRMVGQQALGAFTGLRLDLDKLRRDNEARTNVTRKNGLIINTGDKLTKKEKEQLRQDASAKYGLSAEDIAWADAELKKMQQKGAMAESTIPLEDAPTEDLDRTGRIALLGQLRKLLVEAMAAADRDKAQAAGRDVEPQDEEMCEAGDQMEQVQPDADLEEKENEKENVGMTSKSVKNQMAQDVHVEQFKQLDENQINGRLWPLAEITISGQGPCTRKRHSDGNGGSALSARTPAVRKKARQRSIWSPDAPSVGSDSLQADVDLGILTAMGYSKRHAQEALEENDNDVAAAANWLVMNCS